MTQHSLINPPLVVAGITLPHAAILAPMSGVTDLPFRRAVRRCGGGLVVTEMVASAAVLQQVRGEMRKLKTSAREEAPLSIQLAGWDPQIMAEAAKLCEGLGASFIDINMGCPAKKVTGKLSGSALMRDPQLAAAIMQSVKSAVRIPVTLKMRLGWDGASLNARWADCQMWPLYVWFMAGRAVKCIMARLTGTFRSC